EIDNQEIIDAVGAKAKKAGIDIEFDIYFDQVYGLVGSKDILKLSRILKKDKDLSFKYIRSITGSDFEDHIEIVYSLYSFENNWPVNIKIRLDGKKPQVDSIVSVYRGADWFEREIWEMLGIDIKGHPGLKPLLLVGDEDFHPLLKSFEIKWEKRDYKPTEKFE
ncbi:MAG: NADH-quinone oxidoreductase subunit C, partial [Actinomycetia bacterium]|nr:NADH-quinone oxidoreductase subunit C [Actinomycetes bacterium]